MKNIRTRLLKTLSVTRQATINKLAAQLEINPITVRHYLHVLVNEGLVTSNERRHGVGRPHFVYRLSHQGQQEVSSNYQNLAESLLLKFEQLHSDHGLSELLETIGREKAQSYALSTNRDLDELLDEFCDLLAEQGYQIDWERIENRVYIHNTSCPYHQLKQTHPEICSLDFSLFSHLLAKELFFEKELSAKRSTCIYSFEV